MSQTKKTPHRLQTSGAHERLPRQYKRTRPESQAVGAQELSGRLVSGIGSEKLHGKGGSIHECKCTHLDTHPQGLTFGLSQDYTYPAPAKSGVGISSPELTGGHRLSAVFLCLQHGKPPLWAGRVGAFRGCRFTVSRSANPLGSALPFSSGKRKTLPHHRSSAMTPRHNPARIPSTLRQHARQHRRLALAALRVDQSPRLKLSRYWSHIGQARALEALTINPAAFGLGGER